MNLNLSLDHSSPKIHLCQFSSQYLKVKLTCIALKFEVVFTITVHNISGCFWGQGWLLQLLSRKI